VGEDRVVHGAVALAGALGAEVVDQPTDLLVADVVLR
jgi:hypothetical protein